ncbi:hypothetical protein SprV_0501856400 [Sparganum proliferum]
MDGFQILLHEASKNSLDGSVPAADLLSSASSRSSSRATVRYGEHLSLSLGQFILVTSLPYSWKLPIFMRPTLQMQLLWLCPQLCTEVVTDVERRQKTPLVETISSKLTNLSSSLGPADIAVITISASETRTAIMSEGEQMTPFNLLASIGGIFGLFLGLSGVTTFEVIEAWIIILPHLIPLCRYSLFIVKRFWRQFRGVDDLTM